MEDTDTKIKAQEEYCEKHKVPMFAPKDKCYSCNRNIWDKITLEQATNELITGCPYCNKSFCD